jgi:Uma2 family endonuclease
MRSAARVTPEIEYPESDGKPMAESDVHRMLLMDVVQRLDARYAGMPDVYVSGNLLVYYQEGNPYLVLAPDGFVAFGVPKRRRKTYKVWEEGGRFPEVVFEFTSKSTEREDLRDKFKVYQELWRVKEYFLFDPEEEYLEPSLLGYRMGRGGLRPIKPVRGRLESTTLGITMERNGTRLLLRDAATGSELLLPETAVAQRAQRKARRAVAAKDRAEAAREQAETARDQAEAVADQERQARLRVEAELARLRAELDVLRRQPPATGSA